MFSDQGLVIVGVQGSMSIMTGFLILLNCQNRRDGGKCVENMWKMFTLQETDGIYEHCGVHHGRERSVQGAGGETRGEETAGETKA